MYAGDLDFAPFAANNDTPICGLLARPHVLRLPRGGTSSSGLSSEVWSLPE